MIDQIARNKKTLRHQFNFHAFGVSIGILTNNSLHLQRVLRLLERIFSGNPEKIEGGDVDFRFIIKSDRRGGLELYRNDEAVFKGVRDRFFFFELVESQIRITIAEFAVSKVFLHAGVIGWKDLAIVMPATSFSGKSTLVAELIKRGATYYSDEYAVLNDEGNVEPFPKWLSLRGIIDDVKQVDCSPASLGGIIGTQPIPVGMVLLARFDEKKRNPKNWRMKILPPGAGIMEILPHTLPIRNNPEFVLRVLKKVVTRAIIVKTIRGDAGEFAELLLKNFENQINGGKS